MNDEDYFYKFRVKGTFVDFTENYNPGVSLPRRPSTAGARLSGNRSLVKVDILKIAPRRKVGSRNGRVGPTARDEELVLERKAMEKLRTLLVEKKPFIYASHVVDEHIENKGVITSRIFAILMRFVVGDDHPELLRDWVNHYYTQVESCNIHTKSSLLRALASMKSWELCLKKILELHSSEGRKYDNKYKEVLYQAAFETCIRHDCPGNYREQVTKCIKEANVTIQTPKDVKFLDNLKFMENIVSAPVYEHRTRDKYEYVRNFWRLTKVLESDDYRGASSASMKMSALRNNNSTSTPGYTVEKTTTGKHNAHKGEPQEGHGHHANNNDATTMRRHSLASQSTCTSLQSVQHRANINVGENNWTTQHYARRNPGTTYSTLSTPTPTHSSTMMDNGKYHAYMQSHVRVAPRFHEAMPPRNNGGLYLQGTSRHENQPAMDVSGRPGGVMKGVATPHARPTRFSADMNTSDSSTGAGPSYNGPPALPRSNYGSFLQGQGASAVSNGAGIFRPGARQGAIVRGQEAGEARWDPRSMVTPANTTAGDRSHTVPQSGSSGAPPKENIHPKSRRARRREAREAREAAARGGAQCLTGVTDVSGRPDPGPAPITQKNARSKRKMEGKNMEGKNNTDGPKPIPGNENQNQNHNFVHARKFYPLTLCPTSPPVRMNSGFESSSTAQQQRCDHTDKEGVEKVKGKEEGRSLEVLSENNTKGEEAEKVKGKEEAEKVKGEKAEKVKGKENNNNNKVKKDNKNTNNNNKNVEIQSKPNNRHKLPPHSRNDVGAKKTATATTITMEKEGSRIRGHHEGERRCSTGSTASSSGRKSVSTKLEVTSSENKGQDKGGKGEPSGAYDLREKVDWATATDDHACTGAASTDPGKTTVPSAGDARVHVVSLEERKQHHKERRGRQRKHGIQGTPPESTSSVNVTPVGTHGDVKREDPDTGSKIITSKKAKKYRFDKSQGHHTCEYDADAKESVY